MNVYDEFPIYLDVSQILAIGLALTGLSCERHERTPTL